MKLGTVIGRVTLNVSAPGLKGARYLLVSPFTRESFSAGLDSAGNTVTREPSLVVYDSLGAAAGQIIGYVEGREAAQPFPEPTPIDAISAALVDSLYYRPFEK